MTKELETTFCKKESNDFRMRQYRDIRPDEIKKEIQDLSLKCNDPEQKKKILSNIWNEFSEMSPIEFVKRYMSPIDDIATAQSADAIYIASNLGIIAADEGILFYGSLSDMNWRQLAGMILDLFGANNGLNIGASDLQVNYKNILLDLYRLFIATKIKFNLVESEEEFKNVINKFKALMVENCKLIFPAKKQYFNKINFSTGTTAGTTAGN